MNYTQLTVRLLVYLIEAEGKHAEGRIISAGELASSIAPDEHISTARNITLAIDELMGAGLIEARPVVAEGMSRSEYLYVILDVRGAGIRFVESITLQARKEGRVFAWMWSVVEKAATLSQLIQLAMAASENG